MAEVFLVIRKKGPEEHALDSWLPGLLEQALGQDPGRRETLKTDLLLIRLQGPEVDSRVFYELAELKDPRVPPALTDFLTRPGQNPSAQGNALESLKKIADRQTPAKIVERLAAYYQGSAGDFSLQQSTLQVLGRIPTRRAAEELVRLYLASSDSDSGNPYFLRQDILAALEQVGEPGRGVLEQALRDRAVKNDEKRKRELARVLETLK